MWIACSAIAPVGDRPLEVDVDRLGGAGHGAVGRVERRRREHRLPDVRRRVLAGRRALRDRLRLRRERIDGRRRRTGRRRDANGSAGGGAARTDPAGGGGGANGSGGGGGAGAAAGSTGAGGGGGISGCASADGLPNASHPDQSGREDRADQPSPSSAAAYVTSSRTNFVQSRTARRAATATWVLPEPRRSAGQAR